jgi:dTDP-4-amino-4,6-dideoxygalactose transaminase
MAQRRDELLSYLVAQGIDAKIHYPIPQHLQKASEHLGYKPGDLPKSEWQAKHIISIPVHQHLDEEQIQYVIQKIIQFYT